MEISTPYGIMIITQQLISDEVDVDSSSDVDDEDDEDDDDIHEFFSVWPPAGGYGGGRGIGPGGFLPGGLGTGGLGTGGLGAGRLLHSRFRHVFPFSYTLLVFRLVVLLKPMPKKSLIHFKVLLLSSHVVWTRCNYHPSEFLNLCLNRSRWKGSQTRLDQYFPLYYICIHT